MGSKSVCNAFLETGSNVIFSVYQGRTQRVGVKTPLELDILQKLYYLRKGD